MAWSKNWTMVLGCYSCERQFVFRNLTMDKVRAVPITTPCPHCGARPRVSAQSSTVHRIAELREDTARYRKRGGQDTWHFNQSCSKWPPENYVELDSEPNVGELCNECKVKK